MSVASHQSVAAGYRFVFSFDKRKAGDPYLYPMTDGSAPADDGRAAEGSVRLVGTAHVSAESVDEVERVVREDRPDVVAVELDEGRFRQLKGETPDDLDPKDLLRGSMAFQFLAYWLLSYVQQQLGERFDIQPGADMKAAVDVAEEVGANVALVDRDIQVTVQRFWSRMRFREKLRLVWELALAVFGLGGGEAEEEFDPDDLTDVDVVTAMMEEFREFSPRGAAALIDERDAYLAHHIHALREQGNRVVAVIGAGHRAGVEAYLAEPATLPPMETLTGRDDGGFSFFKLFGVLLSLGFLAFFVLLFMAGVSNTILLTVFGAWFLFNGVFAFGLARLAGAHWQSATVGGLVAWLTSLNPLLAPGWFAGYVELRYKPVNISDIGRLNEILGDEESPVGDLLHDMLAVPLFRLIAIVALTNIGSMLASVLFPFVVLPFLPGPFGSVADVTAAMRAGIQHSIDLLLAL
jgi:pheromone shutdown-related protein TraB